MGKYAKPVGKAPSESLSVVTPGRVGWGNQARFQFGNGMGWEQLPLLRFANVS